MKCLNCGNDTIKPSSKYCNVKCAEQLRTRLNSPNHPIRKCKICDTEFKPKNKRQSFCSKKCSYISDRDSRSNKPKFKKCKMCNNEFRPYTSLDKFCSANCRVDHMKSLRSKNWSKEKCEKRKGENNPFYKHGMRTINAKMDNTGMRLFRKNRNQYLDNMKSNYGYIFCEHCGITSTKFEAHHIIYRSEKPKHEHLHSINNILNLCVKCHNDFHTKKSTRNEIVLSRGLDKLFGGDVLDK